VLSAEVDLAGNLDRLNDEIGRAALRAGRRPEDVTLVAVSKTQPAELVTRAIRAGVRHIGENRVQEAAAKFPAILRLLADNSALLMKTQHPALTFHMVGHLQSNKAGSAVGLFDRVDSVDSLKVAQALSRRLSGGQELAVLLEVYVGDDPRRPGLRPDQLVEEAGKILEVPGLRVEGLMTVAPLDRDARAAFRQVSTLKQTLSETFPAVHFGVLSMGMSDDYLVAIEEDSTEVRIGTALFGPRNSAL
jgi:pyridoxal phosphate enzyme (YggS family)